MNLNPAIWFSQSKQFLTEVRAEYRKVTWPSQKEAVAGTIGVVILVAIMTLVLSLVDVVLGKTIQLILP